MSDAAFTILGIAGSLRVQSYNRALLRAAAELTPEGTRVEIFDLAPIPLYNHDVEAHGDPEPVRRLKDRLSATQALLIVTPEYNYSIPGVLKNAIDWASRPPATTPLKHKPIALMSASTGGFGGVRAQLALRQCFVFTESHALLRPEVMVSLAAGKFDADGHLSDATTREAIRAQLVALVAWARRLTVSG